MTFFESLLALLLAAIILLQVSRRLSLPYPAMLAIAGIALALIPGAPAISFEPNTALALFMAPVIVDAAYDFPIGAVRRMKRQLLVFAVFAVIATASLVALIGWKIIGLPIAAAVALGAIVAPPDAAAATAVLKAVSIPRDADTVLKGESLFNDATALLLFSGALAVLSSGALTVGVGVRIALAVPGGLLFGFVSALLYRRVTRFVSNTLGGNILQFVMAYLIWIIAEHLRLSAVLSTIAFAMTIAQSSEITRGTRMRVQSFAVWSAVVFTLNVFAFLLMGLQGKSIISRMNATHFEGSLAFAGMVVGAVIVTRLVIVNWLRPAECLLGSLAGAPKVRFLAERRIRRLDRNARVRHAGNRDRAACLFSAARPRSFDGFFRGISNARCAGPNTRSTCSSVEIG